MQLSQIQNILASRSLDGWLLYDFRGSNPIAVSVAGLSGAKITRRWFLLVPARGEPAWLYHRIESHSFQNLPGKHLIYAGWQELVDKLAALLRGCSTAALEYSPNGEIPYVSRVDAGTFELLKQTGVQWVSSAELVQYFEARWSNDALDAHRQAADLLIGVKDETFEWVGQRLSRGEPMTEFQIQQAMMKMFDERGLVTDSPPVVAVNQGSADPHYFPSENDCRPVAPGDFLLIDLWAKLPDEQAVFADITWVAWLGPRPPARHRDVFDVVCAARNRGVEFIRDSLQKHGSVKAFEVDDAVRQAIADAGFGEFFVHRTGHSIGTAIHGNGANLDNFETHDTRELIPGTGFSIEPGIYLPGEFGVRSEIDVYMGDNGPEITTLPLQQEIVCLG